MKTTFATARDAFDVIGQFRRGAMIEINGRAAMVVPAIPRGNTIKMMDIGRSIPVQRSDDGRQFEKVHMASHKIAYAIKVG